MTKPCGCPGGYSPVDGRCTTCNAEPPDEIREFVNTAILSFINDPADSPFQRGYLAAYLAMAEEFYPDLYNQYQRLEGQTLRLKDGRKAWHL